MRDPLAGRQSRRRDPGAQRRGPWRLPSFPSFVLFSPLELELELEQLHVRVQVGVAPGDGPGVGTHVSCRRRQSGGRNSRALPARLTEAAAHPQPVQDGEEALVVDKQLAGPAVPGQVGLRRAGGEAGHCAAATLDEAQPQQRVVVVVQGDDGLLQDLAVDAEVVVEPIADAGHAHLVEGGIGLVHLLLTGTLAGVQVRDPLGRRGREPRLQQVGRARQLGEREDALAPADAGRLSQRAEGRAGSAWEEKGSQRRRRRCNKTDDGDDGIAAAAAAAAAAGTHRGS